LYYYVIGFGATVSYYVILDTAVSLMYRN